MREALANEVERGRGGTNAAGATVLVTAGHRKQALGFTRALGRRGYEVIAASHVPAAQTFFSKYAAASVRYESPRSDDRALVEDLLAAVERHDVDVLVPTDHYTTIAVSRFRDLFAPHVIVPVVGYETLVDAEDKERLLAIAEEIGIPVPSTYRPASLDRVDEIAGEIDYPAVVKYAISAGAYGIQYVDSPRELRTAYEVPGFSTEYIDSAWPLVQEYVPGETYDVDSLFVKGEPRATFVAHRTVTFPRSGGRSIVAESADEPELTALATRLLEHLDWHGIAEVEFKIDDRDGRPKLIEVNPRVMGTLDLSIQSGVDLPSMLCEAALTGDVTPPDSYEVGRKVVWLDEGLALRLWHSDDRLGLLRLVAREYASGGTTTVEFDDPGPHAVRALRLGWRGARECVSLGTRSIASIVSGET